MRSRLLRRLVRSNRVLPRKLRFTREGKYFVLIAFGMGFAAINTGNNLLYLLLGMLLSIILLSGFLSEAAIHGAVGRRAGLAEAFAGQAVEVGLVVQNAGRRTSGYSLRAREHIEDEGVLQAPRVVFHLPPGASRTLPLGLTFPRRGRVRSYGVRVETEFPFSLFEKARLFEAPAEYVVWPRLLPGVDVLPLLRRLAGDAEAANRAGHGLDPWGVRDARAGDPPNLMHWKATAKRGRPMVREFEDQQGHEVRLLLVNASVDGRVEAAEQAVSLAATLVEELRAADLRPLLATLDTWGAPRPTLHERTAMLTHLADLPLRAWDADARRRADDLLGTHPGPWLVLAPEPGLLASDGGRRVVITPADACPPTSPAPGGRP